MGSCFKDIESAVGLGSRDELVRATAKALMREASRHCKKSVVEYALWPMVERHLRSRRKPDIRLGNLVVEVAATGDSLDASRQRLFRYMQELASIAPWLEVIRGVVTDGMCAEYYVLGKSRDPEPKARGELGEVLPKALADLCADKVPVVAPEDVAAVFGV
jgi:hypothetical protein